MSDEINNVSPFPGSDDQPRELPVIMLDDFYEKAFLGHSVSLTERPRAVYSLPHLAIREARRLKCGEEAAQDAVIAMVEEVSTTHGVNAPIFVDDQIARDRRAGGRIIRPGG